jgi:hypothetical protein
MLRKIGAWSAIAAATAVGSTASAQAPGPAADAQVVGYVARAEPPKLKMMKAGQTGYMLRGVAKDAGQEAIEAYGISNSAEETAREIAKAYAAAHGLALASAPIVVDPNHPLPATAATSQPAFPGVRYVVDADTPDMSLMQLSRSFIWPADPQVYLQYSQQVRILDGATSQVVAKASCNLGYDGGLFAQNLPTQAEVLGDKAAGLKRLVRAKTDKCLTVLKARLGLKAP